MTKLAILFGLVCSGLSACATYINKSPLGETGVVSPPGKVVTSDTAPPIDTAGKSVPAAVKPAVPATNLSAEMLFRLLTAEIAGQRGNIELAVAQYAQAARESHDPEVVERATRIAVFARDDKIALEMARLWVDLEPDNVDANQVVAAMYIRAGEVNLAKQHLERVITLSDQGADKGFMLVSALLSKEKDKNTALQVMEELIATRQDNPDALYAFSQLALLVGDLNKAHQAVEKVLRLRPKLTEAQILNSTILIRQGKKSEAFDTLQQAVDADPDNVALRNYYARRLVDEKRYEDARTQYKHLVRAAPENQEAIYALGLLSLQMHDLDEAEGYFKRLVDKPAMQAEAYFYLGQIAEARNATETAVNNYSQVTAGQHFIEAQIRIALIDARKGDVTKARERLHSIPAESAELEERLLLAEGEVLREAKRNTEAYEFYNYALTKQPDNNQILYARALAAEKIERLDIALADLETIVKRDPANVQALNALGYTLVDRTERYAEGMAYIQKAYKLQPDDPAILDSLGWANYRMGNHADALKYLRLAFDKLKDAEVAAHLGEVLWVTGDQDAARRIWDTALRDNSSHKLLLDVIKRFTK
ncbi:MAG: tetratricopeptide repeat protein [Gammaproteobacteria bacterium]|nr:tetratricopeptide repeat protein [Gammaproteobacteria bacterium]